MIEPVRGNVSSSCGHKQQQEKENERQCQTGRK